VRPLAVEAIHEHVKPHLLLEHIGGGRAGGLGLQREMHALVSPVLLRVARRGPFESNAEAEPPDRQMNRSNRAL
jgi:hypothetical protein